MRSGRLAQVLTTAAASLIAGNTLVAGKAIVHSAPPGLCTGRLAFATWYASGRRTASGQPFERDGFTAAHRTLPFGSRIVVQNPRTGQSVTVVINDRGPHRRGVTIDLARGAARAIGMHGSQWVCIF
jgi:rare lipoprotein A